MEEQLDEVEEGKLEWHKVISDFYGPFEKTLEKAESRDRKGRNQGRDFATLPCDKCGAMMVYKLGRLRTLPGVSELSGMPQYKGNSGRTSTRPARSAAGKLLQKTLAQGAQVLRL